MENKRIEMYKEDFTDYLLCLALDVGEGMLKNGGEIARVEDTIERICRAYGAVHVEVFSIISMINAAVRMPDGSYSSQLRRVRQTGNNLNALERFNALSRRICRETPSLEEFDSLVHEVKKERPYPMWMQILSGALGAAAFCLFFGGDMIDSLVTFALGSVVALEMNMPSRRLNSMARTVIASFTASLLAGLLYILIPTLGVDSIIIGVIMLLVPGLMFGTAMRDLLCGDLLAGTLRTLQALLQTLMIGFGYMLSYSIIGERLLSGASDDSENVFFVSILTVIAASLAFSVIFRTNKRHLISTGICGVLTFSTYFLVAEWTSSLFWAAFVSSLITALFSELTARVRKVPAIVILMPGIISTVPGGYLYRTVRDFVCGKISSGLMNLSAAAQIALGIAGGIVTISILFGMLMDRIYNLKIRKNVN